MSKIVCYDYYGNVVSSLTQWDTNRILKLNNWQYDTNPIIQWTNRSKSESYQVESTLSQDGTVTFEVPNAILQNPETAIVFIGVSRKGENGSSDIEIETVFKIEFPVQRRAKPSGYVYSDNASVVDVIALKEVLEKQIADVQEDYDNKVEQLGSQYQSAITGIDTKINSAKTALSTEITSALNATLDGLKDGTPKEVFRTESDLEGKESGIYLYYNASDEEDPDNGFVFYWDGENLSDPLFLYNAIKISNGQITYEMLSETLKNIVDENKRTFDSMTEAEAYIAGGSAVAGQVLKINDGDKYKLYLIQNNGGALSLNQVSASTMIGNTLPDIADADADTDYYIQQNGSYVHYRVIAGAFVAVGGDSYNKAEIDDFIGTINRNIQENVEHLQGEIDSKEGYTYAAEYGKYLLRPEDPEETDNVFRLIQISPDGTEEVINKFVIQGGGGGSSASTNLVVEKITTSPLALLNGNKVEIVVNYSSTDEDGDPVDGSFELKVGSSIVKTGALVQGRNAFDITDNCTVGTQKVTLTVTDDGGNSSIKTWTVQLIDISIESSFGDNVVRQAGTPVNFTYTPYGTIQKTVHFVLDGEEIDTFDTNISGIQQTFTLPPQEYGSHLLDCYITAMINGAEVETNHIYKDIIYYDGVSENPIIGCIYRNDHYGNITMKQYDTFPIEYIAYDPMTTTPTVTISVDGVQTETLQLPSSAGVYAYSTSHIGTHTIVISCGSTSVTIKVDVEDLGIDVGVVEANLGFDFNPTGYSNSSANRLWVDENNSDVKLSVSDNFDWTNGGYQLDDDGHQYFCIKAGTRANISYQLFSDQKTFANGAEFKLIFKTTNVRKADTTFLTCISEDEDENVGLVMHAHEAYLSSSGDSLYMPYSENDRIELEYNINPMETDVDEYNNIIPKEGAETYVMSYEDGVGFRPMIYDSTHRFYQYHPATIQIGSDDCDVYIYRMRAYNSSLTDAQILGNFIADAPDAQEMINRYNRNQIYNEAGNLTFDSIADACPNLKVILIEAPHFTNDKKDFVKNTKVQCIQRGGDPILDNWVFSNGYHSGQGTTSNEYGYAARNLDLIFNCDGVNPPNDKIAAEADYVSKLEMGSGSDKVTIDDGTGLVTLTRTSVGTNWFNIKVNVASSEMGNNALLQKRYNDYLPYKSLAQQRDEKIKNDMEFVNCVVFIKETDPDITTHREHQDTDWHFYSLGNIGDSKKTDFSRAYDQEDMNEFTLEISDNTLNNSSFQSGVYLGAHGERVIEDEKDLSAHSYIYPILPSEWNASNKRYQTLYADSFDGESTFPVYDANGNPTYDDKSEQIFASGSFELRYGCKGDFKDGKLVNKTTANKAQLLKNADVWRAFYRWIVTSTDAEFISEYEQWCTKESMLYWYNFTHHFTMIDNRAKNTFWHFARTNQFRQISKPVPELLHIYCELVDGNYVRTTDTEIQAGKTYYSEYQFDMWDYDNDTAMGINNSGELTMPYGQEDIDYKKEGDPTSGWLYNAAESTFWCRTRNLLANDLNIAYQNISPNCWSATNIINEFDNWQNQFPEELWRLHYQQLYIRTYQGGGMNGGKPASPTPRFLKEMMNGRKKYQRRQWVRDQEDYFGTKHLTSNITSDQIMFRCNTPTGAGVVVAPNYTLRLVPYSDMYLSVMFGNSSVQKIRAKAGRQYEINCPFSTMDDTAVLIYCASKIQEINDLSACYIHDNDFSKATRLQRLVIGNNTPGYQNTFLTTLSLGNNALLEYLDIRNCPNLTGSINLSQLNLLETLYAEGTAIKGVIFANNGKIATAHLPASLNTVTMRNLIYLTDLRFAGLDNLTGLIIENSDIDSLPIIADSVDTLRNLTLSGIDWSLGENDDVSGDSDAPSILLETLYQNSKLPNYNINLRGNITVPTIRQKYIDRYKNKWNDLIINYRFLISQKTISFVNEDGSPITVGGEPYVQYVDSSSPYQIKSYDPVGVDMTAPTTEDDEQYKYVFDHWELYTDGVKSGTPYEFGKVINNDITLMAVYNTEIQKYTVTWYEDDSKTRVLYTAEEVPYGSEIVFEEQSENSGYVPLEPLQSSTSVVGGVSVGEYKIFTGWDKSTGCVKGDIEVCGTWDTTGELSVDASTSKYNIEKDSLNDMTMAEIYAISESGQWENFFRNAQSSYKDIIAGHDYTFNNVDEQTIVEVGNPYTLNGANQFIATDKDGNPIKLFGKNARSFTLAVDYRILNDNNGDALPQNAMIISALEKLNNGNEGFAIRNAISSGAGYGNVLWGDKSQRVSYGTQRDITVLRYIAGEDKLYVYSFNGNPPAVSTVANADAVASPNENTDYYFTSADVAGHYRYVRGEFIKVGDDPTASGRIRTAVTAGEYYAGTSKYELTRNVSVNTSDDDGVPLIIGGLAEYNSDTNEYSISPNNIGYATIFWCKIWFDDLGDKVSRSLADWTRDPWRPEYYSGYVDPSHTTTGSPYYLSSNSQKRANASFVMNNQLRYAHVMNIANTNSGGWNLSLMRSFCNYRVFNALPYEWQYLIKKVRVKSYSNSSTVVTSHDNIYIPAAYEVNGSTNSGEVNENATIPWIVSSSTYADSRCKWRGFNVDFSYGLKPNKQVQYTGSTNPILTYGLYGYDTMPDGTPKDPNTGVREGETWSTAANSSNTNYIWVSYETNRKLGLGGGTRFYTTTDEGEITYGYWAPAAFYWLRSPYPSNTYYFWIVYSTGYVYNGNASGAYGVVPCFSI